MATRTHAHAAIVWAGAALLMAGPVHAEPLAVGDPAPPLEVAAWLKGDEVRSFAAGKVYVLEFWATWCGPCRKSIPHLSELQARYPEDVVVIGVSDEHTQKIVQFMCQSGPRQKLWYDDIGYAIGSDPDRSVWNDYMRAAGRRGIPTAFIIGTGGLVEWIGHPARMDDVLASVVAGTWNRQAQCTTAPLGAAEDPLQDRGNDALPPRTDVGPASQHSDQFLQMLMVLLGGMGPDASSSAAPEHDENGAR